MEVAGGMDFWKTFEDLKKHLHLKEIDDRLREQLERQLAWLQKKYQPAKLLTFVGSAILVVGVLGSALALYRFAHLLGEFSLMHLLTKKRFLLMVNILRCGLFAWIFLTGLGIVTRHRWAGISCMIGYVLVQSQSVYVADHILLSIGFSLAAFLACAVVQWYWDVLLMRNLDTSLPIDKVCDHQRLVEESKTIYFWGFYTHCPVCHKKVYFLDNIFATSVLFLLSLGWSLWWYWPIWPLPPLSLSNFLS